MFKMYDYRCVLGHVNEHLVRGSPDAQLCKNCGSLATRQLCSPTSYLEPFSGDFSGASITWARKHEKGRTQAEKANPDT